MIKHLKETHATSNENGFTLIEILIVVIIIGILAVIAIPIFLNQQNAAYDASTKSDLRNMGMAVEASHTENGGYQVGSINATISNKQAVQSLGNNFLVCSRIDGTNFAIYAKSLSGNSFVYKPSTGTQEYPGPINSFTTLCPAAGFGTGTYNYTWGYANNAWNDWIA